MVRILAFSDMHLSARCAAEKLGTLTNSDRRVQRVVPAVEPPFEARDEGEVIWRLGAALGLAGFEGPWDPCALSKQLGQASPAFTGIDVDSVDPEGTPLRSAAGPALETGA